MNNAILELQALEFDAKREANKPISSSSSSSSSIAHSSISLFC